MGILSWDKPEKARSSAAHAAMYQSDSGVDGTYVPNMSREDVMRWKAKFTGYKARPPHPQVEIRYGGGLVIIVCLHEGYTYNHYKAEGRKSFGKVYGSTVGLNLHISTNGPLQWTFDTLAEMNQAIAEAKEFLEDYYNNTESM